MLSNSINDNSNSDNSTDHNIHAIIEQNVINNQVNHITNINPDSSEDINPNLINNTTEELFTNSDEITTDSVNNQQQNDNPYTELFIDNPNNPFFKCKIDKLDYNTDDEESNKKIRIFIIWNYEYNYDYFNIVNIKCFITKNDNFKKTLEEVKNYRNDNASNTTGILMKLNNNGFIVSDIAHVYLIVYYDNAKCNIELYGVFDQELDEEKLIKNISNESIYGKVGKIISNTNITSTNGEGFVIIHNLINIE